MAEMDAASTKPLDADMSMLKGRMQSCGAFAFLLTSDGAEVSTIELDAFQEKTAESIVNASTATHA